MTTISLQNDSISIDEDPDSYRNAKSVDFDVKSKKHNIISSNQNLHATFTNTITADAGDGFEPKRLQHEQNKKEFYQSISLNLSTLSPSIINTARNSCNSNLCHGYLSHRNQKAFQRRTRSEYAANNKIRTSKEISATSKNAHFLMIDDMVDKLNAKNYKVKKNDNIINSSMSASSLNSNKTDESTFQGFSADLNFASNDEIDESKAGLYRISEIHGFLSQMNIRKLLRKTNYNRRELYVMYVRFKALCAMSPSPLGIDYKTFKQGVARLSVEDDLFVKRVYKLIDEDQSDSIEWNEFLTVMSALEKGNRKSQISFFFKIYDLDEDGVISRQDLSQMFLSSSMLGDDKTTRDLCDAFVRRTFKVVTGNENAQRLTEQDVNNYLTGDGANEDVWDLFGRSMLKDFTTRRNV